MRGGSGSNFRRSGKSRLSRGEKGSTTYLHLFPKIDSNRLFFSFSSTKKGAAPFVRRREMRARVVGRIFEILRTARAISRW